ncbi:MFS general substrate transporter [Acephala macrosclerotiorum]|nr:MFS general substrate transporter [Acephala macrosclerotiorum]
MGLLDKYRVLFCTCVISVGAIVIGVDSGIIGTTLGQPSFYLYMFKPGDNQKGLIGAMVSTYYVGNCLGAVISGICLEKFGRKHTLTASTFGTIIGSTIQTSAVNPGMMIGGRLFAGLAVGVLIPVMPTYISELARPTERGRLIGVMGMGVAVGFLIANWIGYGCYFAKGDVAWRVALAMQIPPGVVLLVLSLFLPKSPRWLISQDRNQEAEAVLRKLYPEQDANDIQITLLNIQEQVQFESQQRLNVSLGHAFLELFSKKYIKRTLLAIAVIHILPLSGASVVQNYQVLLYKGLGYSGERILLISGCYGFMGVIGQAINMLFVADKWPRVRTMWVGCISTVVMLVLIMILSRFYGDGSNVNGARAGIACIFIYSGQFAVFFNSTIFGLLAELFPLHLRGYGVSIAGVAQSVTIIWLSQITPIAFAALTWKFYLIFIAAIIVLGSIYRIWLVETANLTLEEIAGAFGDNVLEISGKDEKVVAIKVEQVELEAK